MMIKKYIIAFLLTEISLKKIYFWILRYLTGLRALIRTLPDNFNVNVIDIDLQSSTPICEVLNPTYVLIREKKIECSVDFKNTIDHLKVSVPNIEISPTFENIIKWTRIDLSFIIQCRNYFLPIFIEMKSLLNTDLSFWANIKLNKVRPDEIELSRRVRTTEEIITLHPYIRSANKNLLYKIPVFKKPVYKSYFSNSQINSFKEILANQAKTRRTNIEIISIYDKFNLENYSGIKQDSDNKGLYCYLNTIQSGRQSDTIYYLLIGQKRDTKETVKALATLE